MGRDLNAPRQATSVDSSEGRRQIRRIVPEKAPSTLRHDDERRGLPGLWQGGAEGGTGTPRPLAARSSFLCRAEEPISPSLEVGLRRDGGDAETGAGVDIGGGLIVSDALTGLSADVRVRMLLAHQDEGFSERGMSIAFSFGPAPSTPLGFLAKMTPSWGGQATGGTEALWGRDAMTGLANGGHAAAGSLAADLSYGMAVGGRLVGTPRIGFGTSGMGRDYRFGYGLGLIGATGPAFEFGADVQRRESINGNGGDHALVARFTARW